MPPYLPPEKSVGSSISNSSNLTWNNRLVAHWEKAVYRCTDDLTYMQSTSGEIPGSMKHELESRSPEVSITSDMQITPHLQQKAKKNKKLLDENERGE